jgi:predicted alpha/beta-fold hydrolase
VSLSGHAWTLGPRVADTVAPPKAPASEAWSVLIDDPKVGEVRLTGMLREREEAEAVVVVIHGLGGSCNSPYALHAAQAVDEAGLSCLRLNLRGSDRASNDFYHAGLTDDVAAALASPEVRRYPKVYLMGYSLGGHVSLRYASGDPDPRLSAAAAVCSPLDLARCADNLDRPALWLYRQYLLSGLKAIYDQVALRRPVPLPPAEVRKIQTIRRWDDLTVAPRHGFTGADDYYDKASAGPRLGGLRVPALLVSAEDDPMVPMDSLRPWIAQAPPLLDARCIKPAGHVGFPGDLDLGLPSKAGLAPQVVGWLTRH